MGLTLEHQQKTHFIIYSIILIAIALLSIKIFFILEKTLSAQKEAAYIINISGRQRMLSQLIIVNALEHQKKPTIYSANALEESINEMQASHLLLINQPTIAKTIKNLYFQPNHIDKKLTRYLSLSRKVLENSNDEVSFNSLKEMSLPLLENLDEIVYAYQKNSQEETAEQHHLNLAMLALIFFLIIIKAVYVTLPIFQKLRFYFQLAIKDTLTGLYNRRYFFQALEEEHNRCLRYKTNYSFCMIDIDHFKSVNDQYGHPTGDKILKKVADTIKNEIRTSDQCARFGGEEFSLLLLRADENEAFLASEKIRIAIEKMVHTYKNENISVTISVGIATCAFTSKNKEAILSTKDMIQRADTALYMAKQSGRNKCCLWDNSTSDNVCPI